MNTLVKNFFSFLKSGFQPSLLYLAILFGCFSTSVLSQKETNKWYFGGNAGLDFNTNPPTILTNGALVSGEACASIADAQGNLLFYTNGVTVWNRLHAVMANGTGLDGHISTTQGAMIVKQPGNSNIYFIFTLDAAYGMKGFKYSIVDIDLASGNGSVTTKNFTLFSPCTEKMAAVKHCNGIDTWVSVHDSTNKFMTYLVSNSGVNPVPVVSATGLYYGIYGYAGCIKFAPNGMKLIAANAGIDSIPPQWATGALELLDFNRSTGGFSNAVVLAKGYPTYNYLYGCEFSK